MNEQDDLIKRFQDGERDIELLEKIAQLMIDDIRMNRKRTIYDLPD